VPAGAGAGADLAILITSAGRRVELLEAFRQSAAALGVGLRLHACDLEPGMSAACQRADMAHAVPPADHAGYAARVLEIVRAHGIGLLVPTIDPELAPLAAAKAEFADAGCTAATGSPELVAIARDKQRTAAFLTANGITAPRSALLEEARADPQAWRGPLFLKPLHGSSGRGARPVRGLADVDGQPFPEPMLVQELLHGPEFTVNCFFDSRGALRSAVPHERLRVRGGEVEKGVTRRDSELAAMAARLGAVAPGVRGALCFQAMRGADGAFRMFEINARFGGGYPLAHAAGATFTRWLIEEHLGLPASAHDDWTAGVVMLRHDSSVFLAP
jgi:carbamoyl-phosphate synthase large subunit